MLPSINLIVLVICWGSFFLVWGLGWVYNRVKGPQAEGRTPVYYFSLIALVAVLLLYRFVRIFKPDFSILLPLWVEIVGGICLILFTGLTLWSRFTLSTMWSSQPMVKVGHQLRTDGPYRISRHPIYTGLIGMSLGSVLLSSGNMIGVIAALVVILRLLAKTPIEEKLMIETFGEQYLAYRQQVPQLIPGMQWLKKVFGKTRME